MYFSFLCFQGLYYFCISKLTPSTSSLPEIFTISYSDLVHGISISSDEKILTVLLGSESISVAHFYLVESLDLAPITSIHFSPPIYKFSWSKMHPNIYATLTSGEHPFISLSTFNVFPLVSAPIYTIPSVDGLHHSTVDFDWSPDSHSLVYLFSDSKHVYRLSRVDFSLEQHQTPQSMTVISSSSQILQVTLEPISIDEPGSEMSPCNIIWPASFTWFVGYYNDADGAMSLIDIHDPGHISIQKRTDFFLDADVETKFFASYNQESNLIAYGVTSGSDVEFLKKQKDGHGWVYLSELSFSLGSSLLLGIAWLDSLSENSTSTLIMMRREDERDVLSAVTCLLREDAKDLSEEEEEGQLALRKDVAVEGESPVSPETLQSTDQAEVEYQDHTSEKNELKDFNYEGICSTEEVNNEDYRDYGEGEDNFEETESDLYSEDASEDVNELCDTVGEEGANSAKVLVCGDGIETSNNSDTKPGERKQVDSKKIGEEHTDDREGAFDPKKKDDAFIRTGLVQQDPQDNQNLDAVSEKIVAQKDSSFISLDKTNFQNSKDNKIIMRPVDVRGDDINLQKASFVPDRNTCFNPTDSVANKNEKITERQKSTDFQPINNQSTKPPFSTPSSEMTSKSVQNAKERSFPFKHHAFTCTNKQDQQIEHPIHEENSDPASETVTKAATYISQSIHTETMNQFIQELSSFKSTVDQAHKLQSICLLSPSFKNIDSLFQSVEAELQSFSDRLNELHSQLYGLYSNSFETRQLLSEAQFLFDSLETRRLLSHDQPLNNDAHNVDQYLQMQSRIISGDIEKLNNNVKCSLDFYSTLKKHLLITEEDQCSEMETTRSLFSEFPIDRKHISPSSKHSSLFQKYRRSVWATSDFRSDHVSFPTAFTVSCHQPYVAWKLPGLFTLQPPKDRPQPNLSPEDVFSALSNIIAANFDEIVKQMRRVKKLERVTKELLSEKKESSKDFGISADINEPPHHQTLPDSGEKISSDDHSASPSKKSDLSDHIFPSYWKWDFLKNDLLRMNDAIGIIVAEEDPESSIRENTSYLSGSNKLSESSRPSCSMGKIGQLNLCGSEGLGEEKDETAAGQKKLLTGAIESIEGGQLQHRREEVNPSIRVEVESVHHLNVGQRVPLKGASITWNVHEPSSPLPPSKPAFPQHRLANDEDVSDLKKEGLGKNTAVAEAKESVLSSTASQVTPASDKSTLLTSNASSSSADLLSSSLKSYTFSYEHKGGIKDPETSSVQGQPIKNNGSEVFHPDPSSPTVKSSSSALGMPYTGTSTLMLQNKTELDNTLSSSQFGQQEFKEYQKQDQADSPFQLSESQTKSNALPLSLDKSEKSPSVSDTTSPTCTPTFEKMPGISPQTEIKSADPIEIDSLSTPTTQPNMENKINDKPIDAMMPSDPKVPTFIVTSAQVEDKNKGALSQSTTAPALSPSSLTSKPPQPNNAFSSSVASTTLEKDVQPKPGFAFSSFSSTQTPLSSDNPSPPSSTFGVGASKSSSVSSSFPSFSSAVSSSNSFQNTASFTKDGTSQEFKNQNAFSQQDAASNAFQPISTFGKTGAFPTYNSSSKFGQTSTFGSISEWPSSFPYSNSQGSSNDSSGLASGSSFQATGNDGFKKYLDNAKNNNSSGSSKSGSASDSNSGNVISGFGNVSRNAPSGFASAAINANRMSGFGARFDSATTPSSSFGASTGTTVKIGSGHFSNSGSTGSSGFGSAAKNAAGFEAVANNNSSRFGNASDVSSNVFNRPSNSINNTSSQFNSGSTISNNQFRSTAAQMTGLGNPPSGSNVNNFKNSTSLFGKTSAFETSQSSAAPKSGTFRGPNSDQTSNSAFGASNELNPKINSGFQSTFSTNSQVKPSNTSIWNSARR